MRTKKIRIFLFLLLVFLVILVILMNITFSLPKLRKIATVQMEKVLGRQVSIEELKVNLWRGIEITKLSIENHKDFQPGPFLQGEKLIVTYRLLPLLQRRFVIGKVAFVNPQILIERDEKGSWNFSDLLQRKPSTPEAQAMPPAKPLPPAKKISLLVSKISVTGGKIDFMDRKISRPPTETRLENLNVNVSGFSLTRPFQFNLTGTLVGKEATKLSLKGRLKLPALSYLNATLLIDKLVLSHYASYLQEYAPLRDLTGISNLNLNCQVDKEKHLNIAGKIALKDIGLKFLSQSDAIKLPLERLDNLDASVEVNLTGELTGEIDHPLKVSQMEGSLDIGQGKVKLTLIPEPIDNIKGSMKFEGDKVLVSELGAGIGGCTVTVKGEVGNFKEPYFDLLVSSRIESEAIKDLLPEGLGTRLATVALSGPATLNCTMKGSPGNLSVEGDLKPENISLSFPPSSLSKITGSVNFNRSNLSLKKLKDALSGWKAGGDISIAEGSYNKIKFNRFNTRLALLDQEVKLMDIRCELYEGEMKGQGYLNFSKSAYSFKSDLKNFDISRFLSSVSESKDIVSGKLECQASIEGDGFSPGAISGQGELKIKQGNLIGMPIMRLLGSLLGVPFLREIEFEEISSDFTINNKTVKTDKFRLISEDFDMFAKGSFDFDTNLNYELTMRFSPEASAKYFPKGEYMEYFQDEKGRTIIEGNVTGTFDNPKPHILKAQIDRIIEKKIKKEIKKEFEDLLKEILK